MYCIAKDWRKLSSIASGSGDGVVKRFDLVSREETFSVHAHDGIVKGLCYTVDGRLLSCSTDKVIKLWDSGSGSKEVHSSSFWEHTDHSPFKHTLADRDTMPLTIIATTPSLQPHPP